MLSTGLCSLADFVVNGDRSVVEVNVKLCLLLKVWQDGSLFRLFTARKFSLQVWVNVFCE